MPQCHVRKLSLPVLALCLSSISCLAAEPVKVGVIMPLTGTSNASSNDVVKGMRFALEEINARGGTFDQRPLELIFEDDESSPTKGTIAARKLIEQDKVVAIIGTYNSATAITALKVAKEAGIPMVSGAASSDAVTDMNEPGKPWFFRAFPGSTLQGQQSAIDAVEKLKAKNIAIFHENTSYGRSLADTFTGAAKGAGGTIVAVEAYNSGEQDFYATLTKFKSRKPDAIYIAGQVAEGASIIRQAEEAGLQVQFVGSGSMMTDNFITLAGRSAEGFAISSMFEPNTTNAYGADFGRRFQKRHGALANGLTGIGFDAVVVMSSAISHAKSADPKAIRDALQNSDATPLVLGPDGTTAKFSSKGSVDFRLGMAIVKDGKRMMQSF
jgi:branched-chain amino acid transport system substrate-binding protein